MFDNVVEVLFVWVGFLGECSGDMLVLIVCDWGLGFIEEGLEWFGKLY